MKLACIGNMNNNFFSLVRYLRDRGVDAELLMLDNELEHFGPACDTFDDSYKAYTHRVSWGDLRGYLAVSPRVVARELEPYDAIVACGAAPAFARKAGRTIDVFAPYGTDFMDYPFLRLVRPRWLVSNWAFRLSQRRAIVEARSLMFDHGSPEMDRIVDRIGYRNRRLPYATPMVYAPMYNPESIAAQGQATAHASRFEAIRAAHDLVVFSSNRHIWVNPNAYNWDKGTERLIRGFARFVASGRASAALVLFEYGIDVEHSRRLVAELGIEDQVFWFPVMDRRELMTGLSLADFGVGELAHSFVTCGTIFEALALEKPLLGYREDHLYGRDFPELYPMANVGSAEDIAAVFADFCERPDHYRAMGQTGRRWFQRYGVDAPLEALLDALPR